MECRSHGLQDLLDHFDDKLSYHVTKVILKIVENPSTTTTTLPHKHRRKIRKRPKAYKRMFCLYLGRSKYMFWGYNTEFGEMVKRHFFWWDITGCEKNDQTWLQTHLSTIMFVHCSWWNKWFCKKGNFLYIFWNIFSRLSRQSKIFFDLRGL